MKKQEKEMSFENAVKRGWYAENAVHHVEPKRGGNTHLPTAQQDRWYTARNHSPTAGQNSCSSLIRPSHHPGLTPSGRAACATRPPRPYRHRACSYSQKSWG